MSEKNALGGLLGPDVTGSLLKLVGKFVGYLLLLAIFFISVHVRISVMEERMRIYFKEQDKLDVRIGDIEKYLRDKGWEH